MHIARILHSMSANYKRAFKLPKQGAETFFLWGARQTGKSSLLRTKEPDVKWIDLLQADVFRRYSTHPELLLEWCLHTGISIMTNCQQMVPRGSMIIRTEFVSYAVKRLSFSNEIKLGRYPGMKL